MPEKDVASLDANYASAAVAGGDWNYVDGFAAPAVLEGFPYVSPEGVRSRLPLAVAKQCSGDGVFPMSMQGAGEVLRFRAASPRLALRCTFGEVYCASNRSGSCGFDLYRRSAGRDVLVGNRYVAAGKETLEAEFTGLPAAETDYVLYFPYHCRTNTVQIGLAPGGTLRAPTPRLREGVITFYGSSITNCAYATRPGMLYPAIVGRFLDVETHNLGFAGNCRGDLCIADAVAEEKPRALVLEYDHNAPDAEFLKNTHGVFFRHLRERCPDLPVLMLSRPDFRGTAEDIARRAVVNRTYLDALEAGDRKVDFIDGETFFSGNAGLDATGDACHPSDLGTWIMGRVIADRLLRLLD